MASKPIEKGQACCFHFVLQVVVCRFREILKRHIKSSRALLDTMNLEKYKCNSRNFEKYPENPKQAKNQIERYK